MAIFVEKTHNICVFATKKDANVDKVFCTGPCDNAFASHATAIGAVVRGDGVTELFFASDMDNCADAREHATVSHGADAKVQTTACHGANASRISA